MITSETLSLFEKLWANRIYDKETTYGQAFAKFSRCEISHPDHLFLYNSPYPVVRAWIEEHVHANSKIQAEASGDPSISALHKGTN